jgi:rare lipoprotein A
MPISTRSHLRSASALAVLVFSAGFLAACASPQPKAMVNPKKQRSKEYFSESEYGVKASPRVSNLRSNLKRGGGRDQLGKPYKVRGRMYYPQEDKDYKKVGAASWYGDAFHGRLTANGEIYDMTHLTAAHPTMPLPSYARVTNTANGASVIVRVNDRGPYSHNRLIDLSKRAAELLDYTHTGTAKVQVEYVGRAPLEGRDDQYLMASYRPGNRAPDPSDGLPDGVMIAMNGPTPSAAVTASAAAFPGTLAESTVNSTGGLPLPALGPIAPERPTTVLPENSPFALASLSYAENPAGSATKAFAALERPAIPADDVARSWNRQNGIGQDSASDGDYIAAGSFTNALEAEHLAKSLSAFGKPAIDTAEADGVVWYFVNLYADGRNSMDSMLEAAWSAGASDAMTVRD